MREKGGAAAGGFESERPELADLRRQLEGGLEVLEACSARYRELSAVLQRRGWKEQLRQAPGLLSDALRAESSLPGVLVRLQRRMSGLGVLWPGFVVYFPPRRYLAPTLLDALTVPTGSSSEPAWRSRDRVEVPTSLLLEQLQLLPEERIDALLRKAAESHPELVLWEPRELSWNVGGSSWLEMVRGEEALWGSVPSWAVHQHVGRVLQHWHRE